MRHLMLKLSVIGLILAGVVLSAGGPAHAQSIPEEVEREIRCMCGCSIPFEDCVCDTATAIRESAAGMLATGRTKLEVLDGLVAEWGEGILLSSDPGTAVSPIEASTSVSVPYPDVQLPGPDPGAPISIPDGDITIVDPGPRAAAPIPATAAALSVPGGGSSNMMTWLVPVLSAAGGASVVLAFHIVRSRQAWAPGTRQARRQQRRRSKRSSRR